MPAASRTRLPQRLRLALVCAAAVAAGVPVSAQAAAGGSGAVYTQTNDPAGNHVVAFTRAANGTITEQARYSTGGVGAAATPPFGFPIVDSQGSVELTKNGRLLFAVNAGDDSVSSFRVRSYGLQLVDRKFSGGDLPVSLDSKGRLLYVVHGVSGDVTGFRFTRTGRITRIPGSTEPLSTSGAGAVPAQVGFAPRGRVLAVTLRGPQVIDTLRLRGNDTPRAPTPNPADAPSPFGFEFQRAGNLIVSNAGAVGDPTDLTKFQGSASSYDLARGGALTLVDHVDITGQRATCWVVITKNDRYAFMTNTLSQSVSRFRLSRDGELELLGHTTTGPGFASDEALSRNSRYLYVLVPSIMGGASHIDAYRVGGGGSLAPIGATPSNLPPGVSGLAAL